LACSAFPAAKHWAAEVIYTPMQTAFLEAAARVGARVLNGSGMCVHQAIEAFRCHALTAAFAFYRR